MRRKRLLVLARIAFDARWCSGSTEDFGSSDRGSNPRRAATHLQFRICARVMAFPLAKCLSFMAQGESRKCRGNAEKWQERQDSNPRHSVLETDALPS